MVLDVASEVIRYVDAEICALGLFFSLARDAFSL